MKKISILMLLVLATPPDPVSAENIHQKAARCLARGGADCESACFPCHPAQPQPDVVPQGWNPSGFTVVELITGEDGIPAAESAGDVPLCLGCHDDMGAEASHPVAVPYPRDDRRYSWVPAGPKLFCDEHQRDCRIYCSTCHNPHAWGQRALLRMENTRSALCLACHIK